MIALNLGAEWNQKLSGGTGTFTVYNPVRTCLRLIPPRPSGGLAGSHSGAASALLSASGTEGPEHDMRMGDR